MDWLAHWRSWIRPLVMTFYFLLLVIALPLCVWELNKKGAELHLQAWFVGGLFVMMAIPVSLWGILQHVVNYTQPHLQRYIIRILWMVPIYAFNAWIGMRFPNEAIYFDTLRECYEAYVIYNFMAYLMSFLHSELPSLERTLEHKPQVKHLFPFCCFPPWQNGGKFISNCKHGVLQYTVIRPITTAIALICELAGAYKEGEFKFTGAWAYLTVINNFSQIWAMYCLVLFYVACKEELKPIKPVWKFACVKFVVFFSFWQSVLIAILVEAGVITEENTWNMYTTKTVASSLQDFCICVEMFLAAIAHYLSFPYHPFIDDAAERVPCCTSLMMMFNVSDVKDDVVEHVKVVGKNVKNTVVRRPGSARQVGETERTPLLTAQTETQNKQKERPHSPLVHVDVDIHGNTTTTEGPGEILGADESVNLNNSYQQFVNKPTTPSMNNFADFGSSMESQDSRQLNYAAYGTQTSVDSDTGDRFQKSQSASMMNYVTFESSLESQSEHYIHRAANNKKRTSDEPSIQKTEEEDTETNRTESETSEKLVDITI